MTHVWAEHHVFESHAGTVLFGVDHASLFFIDDQTRDVLQRFGHCSTLDLAQVSLPDREILEGLQESRMLIPAQAPRHGAIGLPDPQGVPLSTMILEVAQDCNLRCTYCYADGGAYGGTRHLLSPARARQAVRSLFRMSGANQDLTLVLFGGEPLLNMPAVKAAIAEVRNSEQQQGKRVQLSLTTNGTLLTPEIIDYLHSQRVSVALSLDGPADLHDSNRPDTAGQGSYARIRKSLGLLLKDSPVPVAARVTLIPSQWHRVEEVFDHLLDLGFHEVGIAPASPITPELLPTREQEEALLAGFRKLAQRFQQEISRGRILPFGNILDVLSRLHLGQTKSIACGAGFGYLAVDASGDFFPCHRLCGEAEFQVGNLTTGPEAEKIRHSLTTLSAGKATECESCWAKTLCHGGCHYENHLREKKLGLAPGSSCYFIRSWLQLGIELYAELHNTGAEKLFARLEKRGAC